MSSTGYFTNKGQWVSRWHSLAELLKTGPMREENFSLSTFDRGEVKSRKYNLWCNPGSQSTNFASVNTASSRGQTITMHESDLRLAQSLQVQPIGSRYYLIDWEKKNTRDVCHTTLNLKDKKLIENEKFDILIIKYFLLSPTFFYKKIE
jgi:hypothetical protein